MSKIEELLPRRKLYAKIKEYKVRESVNAGRYIVCTVTSDTGKGEIKAMYFPKKKEDSLDQLLLSACLNVWTLVLNIVPTKYAYRIVDVYKPEHLVPLDKDFIRIGPSPEPESCDIR